MISFHMMSMISSSVKASRNQQAAGASGVTGHRAPYLAEKEFKNESENGTTYLVGSELW